MRIVTCKQMNTIDKNASEVYQIPSIILMEHAAYGVYEKLMQAYAKDRSFFIVCGSGNNGGDGFALARLLYVNHYSVRIHMLGNIDHLTKDAKINYDICKAMDIEFNDTFNEEDIIVDCIFGTGLTRIIEGVYKEYIEKINNSKNIVISMDIPSGIHCDSGEVMGVAVKAHITYTMECGKMGLYVYPGRIYANRVEVISLHIPTTLQEEVHTNSYLIEEKDMKQLLPKRSVHSNKGNYGKVLCVGGSLGMSGAISLASKAALKCGCGLMTCAIPKCIHEIVAKNVLESMSVVLEDKDGHICAASKDTLSKKMNDFTCILIGCGIGRSEDIKEIVECLYDSEVPLIIDADGLFALKGTLRNRKNTILTPHLKEFATLMDVDVKDVVEHTMYYVDEFCKKYKDITLVLKSETTIIAQDIKRYINTYGNNGLAKGGSGDVLAGMITGFYAQTKDTVRASTLGVFLHAFAADTYLDDFCEYSLLPSDVILKAEQILTKWRKEI